jgi:site-specific recombinase XerD
LPIFRARDFRKIFRKNSDSPDALKRAEVNNFRWHDLRHCTASYLAMGGASMVEIAAVLGHKTLDMVKRYSHLSDGHIANVVERMNSKLFGGA